MGLAAELFVEGSAHRFRRRRIGVFDRSGTQLVVEVGDGPDEGYGPFEVRVRESGFSEDFVVARIRGEAPGHGNVCSQ